MHLTPLVIVVSIDYCHARSKQ